MTCSKEGCEGHAVVKVTARASNREDAVILSCALHEEELRTIAKEYEEQDKESSEWVQNYVTIERLDNEGGAWN